MCKVSVRDEFLGLRIWKNACENFGLSVQRPLVEVLSYDFKRLSSEQLLWYTDCWSGRFSYVHAVWRNRPIHAVLTWKEQSEWMRQWDHTWVGKVNIFCCCLNVYFCPRETNRRKGEWKCFTGYWGLTCKISLFPNIIWIIWSCSCFLGAKRCGHTLYLSILFACKCFFQSSWATGSRLLLKCS